MSYLLLALLVLVIAMAPKQAEPVVPEEEKLKRIIVASVDWHAIARCLATGGGTERSTSARNRLVDAATIAIVAVESYSRPVHIRRLKSAFARIYWTLTGTLPNVSLGPGQMKPTTAARVIGAAGRETPVSQAEIWQRLLDHCGAVRLVRMYFAERLADVEVHDEDHALEEASVRDRIVEAVQQYNGQARRSTCATEACSVYPALAVRLTEHFARGHAPAPVSATIVSGGCSL